MKLVRIARDLWDVLAIVDHRGHCQVLEFLEALAPKSARFLARLYREAKFRNELTILAREP